MTTGDTASAMTDTTATAAWVTAIVLCTQVIAIHFAMATATDPICSTARLAQAMPIWMHMDTVCVTPDIMVTIVTCRTIHFSYTHAMVIVAEDVPVLMHLTVMPV